MAKRIPSISDAEWQVMEVVWARPDPVAANEIVARLEPSSDWKEKTIKTMLNRLVNKGALGYEPDGKRYLYKPKVARDECVRVQTRSFLSRVFGGATGAALLHFVEEHDLTPAEIEQLRRVLARKEK
ncbi:MAG: BlaI/MecI/CopY family transcriptional regulator [Planctomycetota bacterium]|nr:BlaI/MecI/CopY family transcriptional regulator [Planctomycetota bacterium]